MNMIEDASKYGKETVDNGLKSWAALTQGFQTMAGETAEFSKTSFEKGSAAVEKLMATKTLEKALEIQAEFAKDAYEDAVSQMTKMGELYADLFKGVYKPFESAVAKAK